MQALRKRNIRSGSEYAPLFPAASGVMQTIKSNAGVSDTLGFIRQVVPATLHQTRQIAAALKGRSVYDTCRNIWHFVYQHIAYKKDEDGYEQIRSPRRSWRDRRSGVDCDCYSTFISSILTNLKVPHKLRITKYARPHFQHVYPIVPHGSGYITLDCVTDRFDYEVPFTEKRDVTMDLQFLDGLDALPYSSTEDRIIDGLDGEDDSFGELGLFGKKKKKKQQDNPNDDPLKNMDAVPVSGSKKKKKGFFKKALNVVNKLNPATLLMRNGVLVAMKLNIGKIASRLRWSYLTPRQAQAKGIDLQRYVQLVKTRQKLDTIFDGAGGNPNNLKKAILKGKGNKDKAVNGLLGLGYLPLDEGIETMSIRTPLPQLLGPEIYHDENVRGMEGFEGFGELGEPVTGATLAAAASVIAAIAGALKKVGNIFGGKKTEGSEDFSEEAAAAGEQDAEAVKANAPAATANNPAAAAAAATFSAEDSGGSGGSSTSLAPSSTSVARRAASGSADEGGADDSSATSDSSSGSGTGTAKTGFWQKNKSWLLPVSIGAGALTIIAIGMKMMKPAAVPAAAPRSRSLNGPPAKRRRRRTGRRKTGHQRGRKKRIALL